MEESSAFDSGEDNTSAKYEALLQWVSSQTGLSFRGQRENAVEVLARTASQAGIDSVDQFRRHMERDRAVFDDLIGELTVGETYFFRDQGQFRLITGQFLQRIHSLPSSHQIRVWSAGCATGEEAWSLAIILAEAGLSDRSHVLGTDISRPSLMQAQVGRYREWSMRGEAALRMKQWISQHDGTYTVAPRLRPMVSFEYLNLSEDTYPSFTSNTVGMDLILCRNVLIYFDRDTIRRVAEQLFQCLSPGGWLMTGASDPSLSIDAPFEVISTPAGRVYVRPDVQDIELSAPPPQRTRSKVPPPAAPRSPVSTAADPAPVARSQPERVSQVESALDRGNYLRVLQLTAGDSLSARLCELRVRALANLDVEQAEVFCSESIEDYRISKELNYLHTILLMELGRFSEAAAAAKRVVYLDPDLAVAHMALGTVLQRLGETCGARRAFRSAKRICQALPADALVPLADGEHAGRLAESASRHLSLLGENPRHDPSSL